MGVGLVGTILVLTSVLASTTLGVIQAKEAQKTEQSALDAQFKAQQIAARQARRKRAQQAAAVRTRATLAREEAVAGQAATGFGTSIVPELRTITNLAEQDVSRILAGGGIFPIRGKAASAGLAIAGTVLGGAASTSSLLFQAERAGTFGA